MTLIAVMMNDTSPRRGRRARRNSRVRCGVAVWIHDVEQPPGEG